MVEDLFTREELAMIHQLRNAPQPELKPRAVNAIRHLMLQELNKPSTPRPPRTIKPASLLIGAAIALAIVIVVVYALLISRPKPIEPTPGTSNGPSQTTTGAPTPTAPSVVSPDANGSILQPTFRPVPVSTVEATPAATETVDNDTVMVIEGPVQAINANIITIFGTTIWIDPGDPVLIQLQVGKMVRIEGRLDPGRDSVIAVRVIIVTVSSPGLPAGCKMSKRGHIKCSKKKK
jgi:hypothetical protein